MINVHMVEPATRKDAHIVSFFPGAVEFDRETNLIIIHAQKGAPVVSGVPNSEDFVPYISMTPKEFEDVIIAAKKSLGMVLDMLAAKEKVSAE